MALQFCQTKMSQRKLWGVILILVQFFTLAVYHAFLGGSIYYGQDIPDNFWQTSSCMYVSVFFNFADELLLVLLAAYRLIRYTKLWLLFRPNDKLFKLVLNTIGVVFCLTLMIEIIMTKYHHTESQFGVRSCYGENIFWSGCVKVIAIAFCFVCLYILTSPMLKLQHHANLEILATSEIDLMLRTSAFLWPFVILFTVFRWSWYYTVGGHVEFYGFFTVWDWFINSVSIFITFSADRPRRFTSIIVKIVGQNNWMPEFYSSVSRESRNSVSGIECDFASLASTSSRDIMDQISKLRVIIPEERRYSHTSLHSCYSNFSDSFSFESSSEEPNEAPAIDIQVERQYSFPSEENMPALYSQDSVKCLSELVIDTDSTAVSPTIREIRLSMNKETSTAKPLRISVLKREKFYSSSPPSQPKQFFMTRSAEDKDRVFSLVNFTPENGSERSNVSNFSKKNSDPSSPKNSDHSSPRPLRERSRERMAIKYSDSPRLVKERSRESTRFSKKRSGESFMKKKCSASKVPPYKFKINDEIPPYMKKLSLSTEESTDSSEHINTNYLKTKYSHSKSKASEKRPSLLKQMSPLLVKPPSRSPETRPTLLKQKSPMQIKRTFRYDDEESDYEEIDTSAIPIADALPRIQKLPGELDTPIAPALSIGTPKIGPRLQTLPFDNWGCGSIFRGGYEIPRIDNIIMLLKLRDGTFEFMQLRLLLSLEQAMLRKRLVRDENIIAQEAETSGIYSDPSVRVMTYLQFKEFQAYSCFYEVDFLPVIYE